MNDKKSLVYLDDVVQRAFKDILIPILGYRDTSVTLGQYSNEIENIKGDITSLRVPDKDKMYIHENMSQPITIYIPDTAYGLETPEPSYEDVKVYIEFKNVVDGKSSLLGMEVVIPGGLLLNSDSVKPYCSFSNQEAHDILKTVYVKAVTSNELTPAKVVQIYFPRVNKDTVSDFSRGVVTLYSQNRDVEKVNSWDGVIGNEVHITHSTGYTIELGSVATFDDVPNKDTLVRSNSVRSIEAVTSAAQEYLQNVNKTDKNTAYFEIESPESTTTGTIRFESVGEIQGHRDILMDIFGQDWSGINVQFSDNVTDISEAFRGFNFVNTPRQVAGRNIKVADGLFKDTPVSHISNQSDLLSGMPKLESINSMFENTQLSDAITLDLIAGNPLLLYMNRTFRNTLITNTDKFWEIKKTYKQERDPNLSPLLPTPASAIVGIEGNGCFESVNTLPSDLSIPDSWKVDSPNKVYASIGEFMIKRQSLLSQFSNDLSNVSITISEFGASLDNMFANTMIRKAPKEIIAQNAVSINGMFYACSELIDVKPSCIAKLASVRFAKRFLMNCARLTVLDQSIFSPLKNVEDYTESLAGLKNITGPTPITNGKHLWELAGTQGYPAKIVGTGCFMGSYFDDIDNVPKDWGGLANA